MKTAVYFAGAIRGNRNFGHFVKGMIEHIQNKGVVVLSEHIIKDNPNALLAEKIGKPYEKLTVTDIESQDIAWIDQASHFIAEVSGASTGVGREIEYATTRHLPSTRRHLPILCLYHNSIRETVSAMVRGMNSERYPHVRIAGYDTLAEACDLLDTFLS